jgi:hypothetical protein
MLIIMIWANVTQKKEVASISMAHASGIDVRERIRTQPDYGLPPA